MEFSPRRRDLTRLGVSTLTALAGAGSLTAVGWFAGTAARQHNLDQARAEAQHAAAAAKATDARARYEAAIARRSEAFPKRVLFRPRPSRTVVHTRYVTAASAPVTVGGGTLNTPTPQTQPPPPVVHHAPPPPPPPPPPPAPSSGS